MFSVDGKLREIDELTRLADAYEYIGLGDEALETREEVSELKVDLGLEES